MSKYMILDYGEVIKENITLSEVKEFLEDYDDIENMMVIRYKGMDINKLIS